MPISPPSSFSPGGPPPPQYPPQGWGNAYPQWQPPAPHDPSKCLLEFVAFFKKKKHPLLVLIRVDYKLHLWIQKWPG